MANTDIIGTAPEPVYRFALFWNILGLTLLSSIIGRRITIIGKSSFTRTLALAVYVEAWLFVTITTMLRFGAGLRNHQVSCEAISFLCNLGYVGSKSLLYMFLIDRVYLIRSKHKCKRLQSKLFIFNVVTVLVTYGIIIFLTFYYRIEHLGPDGECIIGNELPLVIPGVVIDTIINAYLTALFLAPLIGVVKMDSGNDSPRIRKITKKAFIGSCITTIVTAINFGMLGMSAKTGGQMAWMCIILCTTDLTVTALVLHWLTSSDKKEKPVANPSCDYCKHYRAPPIPRNRPFAAIGSIFSRGKYGKSFVTTGARATRGTVNTEATMTNPDMYETAKEDLETGNTLSPTSTTPSSALKPSPPSSVPSIPSLAKVSSDKSSTYR